MKIGVMGAGSIGCSVGGMLQGAGADVVFVGRDRLKKELEKTGLTVVDLDGRRVHVPPEKVSFATDASALADCEAVLCCVKSAQTEDTARTLATILPRGTLAVSFQNGVRNADLLREHMKEQTVLGGIVGFNVLWKDDGTFRRATSGPLAIEASSAPRLAELARALERAGFDVELRADIRALQWSKLIMNLNNAVSALSGAPTRDLVLGEYRRILAAVIEESLGVLRKAGIRPARFGALPVSLFPRVLRLPMPLLRLVARAQLKIDPEARSSMWEDLTKGRATEVDYLNGEIVRLAESSGGAAPLNRRVVALVHQVEKEGRGSPKLSADALWQALQAT